MAVQAARRQGSPTEIVSTVAGRAGRGARRRHDVQRRARRSSQVYAAGVVEVRPKRDTRGRRAISAGRRHRQVRKDRGPRSLETSVTDRVEPYGQVSSAGGQGYDHPATRGYTHHSVVRNRDPAKTEEVLPMIRAPRYGEYWCCGWRELRAPSPKSFYVRGSGAMRLRLCSALSSQAAHRYRGSDGVWPILRPVVPRPGGLQSAWLASACAAKRAWRCSSSRRAASISRRTWAISGGVDSGW